MQLSLETGHGQYFIRAYKPGEIKINDTVYTQSVILTPTSLERWKPSTVAALTPEDIPLLWQSNPKIILIGTGEEHIFLAPELVGIIPHGIGVEIMTTAAACRTFNLLCSEGRAVAVGLIV